jgi:nucleoside-diphosphate-sugar epimerase
MSKVLVTGGNGYVGTQLIAALLRDGREVRATARSLDAEAEIRAAVIRGDADDAGLEVVVANLMADDGWAAALAGVDEVHHVASPIPAAQPDDPDELVLPAREGTLRVLRAARDADVRRLVITSSFAAVGYSPKPVRDYDEADWTDPDTPGLPPYPRSKAVAERAAWDFIKREGGGLELAVVNPTFIMGPTLTMSLRSTLILTKAMVEGTLPPLPPQRFGVVDVRDVADAHIKAMVAAEAVGKRYLLLADGPTVTWQDLADTLRNHLGAAGGRVSVTLAPGDDPSPLTIHNDLAKRELGWQPRPLHETIVETVDSLRELGLLEL